MRLQPARPVAVPQPDVLVRDQRRHARQGAGPGARLPHRPGHQGRGGHFGCLEFWRKVPDAQHAAHAGPGRARAGALPRHARAARAGVLHGRAARVRAQAARARAQRLRAAPGARHARLHHGRARRLQPQAALAGARRLLPAGRQRLYDQEPELFTGREAGRSGQSHEDSRPCSLPSRPLQCQEEPVLLFVRYEARRLRAADDRQRGHDGLPLSLTCAVIAMQLCRHILAMSQLAPCGVMCRPCTRF